ncbi:MAG: lamin tail domain-containing protein [Candidatus Cloacimonadaceae bacterium]|nr:lamin tail domain-containing protein [Candidatus Cloacimonadota bacterium]MDX9949227.1 lamin tail domain-containing protein [Candidatus Syntrophosphaera sp.]
MKLKTLAIIGGLLSLPLFALARVVINEVCFNPVGPDSGKEWIELYNAGDEDLNLEGAKLFSGGRVFTEVFEFPHFILRSKRFLLIGDSQVENAVFVIPLAFQNGGSATDGIRYVSPDGTYTDTVLYDQPNLNMLPDDSGYPGVSFAPNPPEGWSLARRMDGLDTDNCALDFIGEPNPTPGLPNRVRADYALLHPRLWMDDNSWNFELWVKNVSDLQTPIPAELQIYVDGLLVASHSVPSLPPGDSLNFEAVFPSSSGVNHAIYSTLELPNDPNEENNHLVFHLNPDDVGLLTLNEVMYYPQQGLQEWVEIFIPLHPIRSQYKFRDRAGNTARFTLPPKIGYFVICPQPELLALEYPDCPQDVIIGTQGWAALNNDGDDLYLLDGEDNILDSMSYVGSSSHRGKSLERATDNPQLWRVSLDPSGSTPGRENSQPAVPPDIADGINISGSPCNPLADGSIIVSYKLESDQNKVNCKIYDQSGRLVHILADQNNLPGEGALIWDGRFSNGKPAPRGRYYILWESRASGATKVFRKQLSAVVFHP